MARDTKKAFLARQRRKGRSDAQADADWRGARRMRATAKRKAAAAKKTAAPACSVAGRRLRACGTAKRKAAAAKKTAAKKTAAKKTSKTPRRKTNPVGSLPVLVMNPVRTAAMKKRRKKPATPKRRRYRRRRNPSIDVTGLAVAGAGALVPAGGMFLLDGTTMSKPAQAGIIAGIGLLGGAAISLVAPSLGKGVMGAGIGIAGLELARQYLSPPVGEMMDAPGKVSQPSDTSAVRRRVSSPRAARQVEWRAVRAQLGCPSAGCGSCSSLGCPYRAHVAGQSRHRAMGAVRATVGGSAGSDYNWGSTAVQAQLRGLN